MSSHAGLPTSRRKRELLDDDQDNALPAPRRTKLTDTIALDEVTLDSEDNLRYCVTKKSMMTVKEQLIRLTKKNKEINASIQEMREGSVDELLSIMRRRKILIDQLGRSDLPEELRGICMETLPKRNTYMYTKEEELISVEELLGAHEAVLEYAHSACQELEEKIEAYEDAMQLSGNPGFTMDDFPRMQALAKLTSVTSRSVSDGAKVLERKPVVLSHTNPKPRIETETDAAFALFPKLPIEVRLMIWLGGLPGPRVITHDSKHNRQLPLLAVCMESRQVVRAKYLRFLSPGPKFPRIGSSIVYVDPDIDTIVRDLTWVSVGISDASLFDLEGPAFNLGCFRLFTGLARVKHLALAFDVFHDNGGALFSQLQACCPDLETLTLFPSSQLQECPHVRRPRFNGQELRFIDFDSNLTNLIELRWNRCLDRALRNKALRGMVTLASLSLPAAQYGIIFPEYVENYGQDWKPLVKLGLLMQWSQEREGWRTRYLEGDRYSQGFPGDDGKLYRGFIESRIVCDANGELLSRYDGIHELFAENT